ncbi:MAG: hypothetical protein LC734_03645, partial [Acidobacteria bacterium]|nr:hypothetical protein [Acidobacteriota bacterium]
MPLFANRPWQQFIYANINQNVNKHFNYFAFVSYNNNNYDFFYPAGSKDGIRQINPGPGKQFDSEIYLEWKPIDPLRASASYRKSRLVRNDNRVRAFDSDIVSIRSTYQFTRFIFTRARLDYDST